MAKEKKPILTADQDVVNGRLSWGERLAFASGEFGHNFILQMLATFSAIYLTDVALLPAGIIATIQVVTRFIDAFNDVATGWLLDNTRIKLPKWLHVDGKFRPWMIISTPLAAIVLVLFFAIPSGASQVFKLSWYTVIVVLNGFLWDFVNGSHGSLFSRMTQNAKERNLVSALNGIFVMIAVMVVSWFVPFMENMLGGQQGYLIAAIIFNVLMIAGMFVAAFFTKERVQDEVDAKQAAGEQKTKYDVKEMTRLWAKNKALVILFAAGVLTMLAQGFMTAMNTYYFKYYWGDLTQMWKLNTFGGILIIPSVIASPFLANWMGKKRTYVFGLVVAGITTFLRGFIPAGQMGLLMAIAVPSGIGTGIFLGMSASIASDAVEFGEWKLGIRAEGIASSINNFLRKLLTGLAGALPLWVLGLTGYIPNVEQSPEAIRGILLVAAILPGILYVSAAIVFGIGFPLNKQTLKTMMEELRERREVM